MSVCLVLYDSVLNTHGPSLHSTHPTPKRGTLFRYSTHIDISPVNIPQLLTHAQASKAKKMEGELEVAIMADTSHRYFVGERTIVRFRLMG